MMSIFLKSGESPKTKGRKEGRGQQSAHQVKVFAAKPEGLDLLPGTHIVEGKTPVVCPLASTFELWHFL